ncbi:MAG: LD-carboxypeptidase [Myxococcota bacterium]
MNDSALASTTVNLPPALREGACVHVVAPSGPVDPGRLDKGLRALRRVVGDVPLEPAANLLERDGYFAGSDAARADSLHKAFADPDPGIILCARGGYGITRLLGRLDPARLRRNPKAIVGFSDVTALLSWAWVTASVASIHGPVVTQLGGLHPGDVDHLHDLLRGEVPPPIVASEGTALNGGTVEGRLVVGNLEVLRSLVGTRFFPPLRGNILAIEEINEVPYRIDRSLTQLLSSGVLRGVRGIAIGQLSMCDPPNGLGPTAEQVVVERLGTLGVPLVTGFEFGHDPARNRALPFGTRVRLRADDCAIELLEPVTQ